MREEIGHQISAPPPKEKGLRGIEWVIFGTERATKPRFT
jgi:hypothetical protein